MPVVCLHMTALWQTGELSSTYHTSHPITVIEVLSGIVIVVSTPASNWLFCVQVACSSCACMCVLQGSGLHEAHHKYVTCCLLIYSHKVQQVEYQVKQPLKTSSPLPDETQLLPELYVASRLEVKLYSKHTYNEFITFLIRVCGWSIISGMAQTTSRITWFLSN